MDDFIVTKKKETENFGFLSMHEIGLRFRLISLGKSKRQIRNKTFKPLPINTNEN